MFGRKKEQPERVKTFSAITSRGLDKKINKFSKNHEILEISYTNATAASTKSAMIRYKDN